jgi:hypothetical protein
MVLEREQTNRHDDDLKHGAMRKKETSTGPSTAVVPARPAGIRAFFFTHENRRVVD